MAGIVIGAVLLGLAFGWRADILGTQDYRGGTFFLVYALGGLGFGILVGGILQEIRDIVRPGSVRSFFKRREG